MRLRRRSGAHKIETTYYGRSRRVCVFLVCAAEPRVLRNRCRLLGQIQKGKKLKKAVTVRSPTQTLTVSLAGLIVALARSINLDQ
jgi:hypothetical protein